jgi:hypothetical protein
MRRLKREPESGWDFLKHSAIVYTLFPNALLVWQGDHFETWRAFPIGNATDKCVAEAARFTPAPALSDKAAALGRQLRSPHAHARGGGLSGLPRHPEGLRRSSATGDHLAPEPALGHYHRKLREALGL